MTQSTDDMISVRDAAKASGYTKTHIHELAKSDVIRYRMVTDNFRLVSLADLMAYKENGKAPVAEEEMDALQKATFERDGFEAALEEAKDMAMSIHLHGDKSTFKAVDIYAVCFNALNPDDETEHAAPTAAEEATE